MNLNLKICSLSNIVESDQKFDYIISLVDPDDSSEISKISSKARYHYSDFFYDIEELEENIPGAPTKHQINKLIIYYQELVNALIHDENQSILIHCYMGQCRSTAAAMILLFLCDYSPSEALEYVLNIRSHALPNLRMLKFADEILGLSEKNGLYWPVFVRAESMLLKTRNPDDIMLF